MHRKSKVGMVGPSDLWNTKGRPGAGCPKGEKKIMLFQNYLLKKSHLHLKNAFCSTDSHLLLKLYSKVCWSLFFSETAMGHLSWNIPLGPQSQVLWNPSPQLPPNFPFFGIENNFTQDLKRYWYSLTPLCSDIFLMILHRPLLWSSTPYSHWQPLLANKVHTSLHLLWSIIYDFIISSLDPLQSFLSY